MMLKCIKKGLKNNKGFTLIELIIVIAILGILAAIAIPRFSKVQMNSKKNADVVTAKNIAKAVQTAYINGDITTGNIDLSELKKNDYLDTIPNVQHPSHTGDSFSANVSVDSESDDGAVTVSVGTIQLYPTVAENSDWD